MLRGRLAQARVLLEESIKRKLSRRHDALRSSMTMLQTLSPDATLARGYSITFDAEGHAVRSAQDLRPGDTIRSRFRDGETEAVVGKILESKKQD